MRVVKLVAMFLVVTLVLSCLAGCEKKQEKTETKAVVVLVDLSESTRDLRNLYLESLKEVIGKIKPGDFFMVAKITASSVSEPEVPVKEDFKVEPKDAAGRPTDNPLLVKKITKKAEEELKAKKPQLIEKLKGVLLPGEERREKVTNTDIMSSLAVAQNAFQNYQRDRKILVILSDMLEDSERYNFYRENFTPQRISEIISAEKTNGRLPDLNGVDVYVVAATKEQSNRFFDVQKFWLEYFKACGARLARENYSSTLLKFADD
ncbi:MAG: hypothetical protein K6U74_13195 [Firmicutes bacterium]|nr:hypothetical protein [Bacillota bacterium]